MRRRRRTGPGLRPDPFVVDDWEGRRASGALFRCMLFWWMLAIREVRERKAAILAMGKGQVARYGAVDARTGAPAALQALQALQALRALRALRALQALQALGDWLGGLEDVIWRPCPLRHPGESRDPWGRTAAGSHVTGRVRPWVPAFAGMTRRAGVEDEAMGGGAVRVGRGIGMRVGRGGAARTRADRLHLVIPAQARIHNHQRLRVLLRAQPLWIPACAGMTVSCLASAWSLSDGVVALGNRRPMLLIRR